MSSPYFLHIVSLLHHKMLPFRSAAAGRRYFSWAFLQIVLLLGHGCWCYQYKVGDLDAWGVPPSSNPHVYSLWSEKNHLRLGDSLLFLYPPSLDSVIQVTEAAYNSYSLADPILKLANGNSVFNLTTQGRFYIASGVPGHCQKGQKLAVAVPSTDGSFFPSANAPSAGGDSAAAGALPAGSPSYPIVFGPTPAQGSGAAAIGAYVAIGSGFVVALLCLL